MSGLRPRSVLASIAIVFASCASAYAQNSFTLENVAIDGGGTTYRIARLDVTDSILSRDALFALLEGRDGALPSQRWAKITAARMTMPELVSDQRAGDATQRVTYRDVVFRDVAGGKVGQATAAAASIVISGPQTGEITGRTGAITLDGVDLSGLAHLLVEGRTSLDEPARSIISQGVLDGIDVDLPDGRQSRVGRIVFKDAGGRALAVPVASLVEIAPKSDAVPTTPERRRAMSSVVADILLSQSLASLDLTDIETRAKAGDDPAVKVGAFHLEGISGGRIGRMALERLALADGPARGTKIDALSADGLDLTPLLSAAVSENGVERLALRFDRIALRGLATTLAGVGQPIALSLARASLDVRDWRDLVPNALALSVDNLAFDLPTDDPRARPLLDLGYRKLDLTAGLQAAYDPTKQELAVRQFALSAPEIGNGVFEAAFTNVGPDFLSRDAEKARSALAASLFKRASVTVTDTGLLTRLIETQARRDKLAVADVRARWAAGVRVAAMAFLVDNPDRGAVADAAERFMRNGGRFGLTADAPSGLGLIDAMLAGGLPGLLAKVKLTVER